jgi:putative sigma-54 modulation protein
MQIKISTKHMDITPAIEDYATKKVQKFSRYFDRIQQIDVVIDKVRNGYAVEIRTDVEHHDDFVATSTDPDLYACIDLGVDRAIRQLTDHKSKLRDNKHHTPMSGQSGKE